MFMDHCNPGAGSDPVRTSGPAEFVVVDGINDAFRCIQRLFGAAVTQNKAELIAAETGKNIAGPEHGAHQYGYLVQQSITRCVARAVVDRFKEVEVEHHKRV
jgi:hypothetical protein